MAGTDPEGMAEAIKAGAGEVRGRHGCTPSATTMWLRSCCRDGENNCWTVFSAKL